MASCWIQRCHAIFPSIISDRISNPFFEHGHNYAPMTRIWKGTMGMKKCYYCLLLLHTPLLYSFHVQWQRSCEANDQGFPIVRWGGASISMQIFFFFLPDRFHAHFSTLVIYEMVAATLAIGTYIRTYYSQKSSLYRYVTKVDFRLGIK